MDRDADTGRFKHRHHWQPGPLIPGQPLTHTGGSSWPDTILLVCGCGALRRRRLPGAHAIDQIVEAT